MHQVTVHFIQSRIHTVRACLVRTCHCTLGRMTRIFYVLLQYHRSGTDSKMSRHRKLILEKKMFLPLKPDTCYHESGTPPLSYSLSWWPHELWHVKCANLCHANSWSTQFLILHVCVNRDVLQCRTVVASKCESSECGLCLWYLHCVNIILNKIQGYSILYSSSCKASSVW